MSALITLVAVVIVVALCVEIVLGGAANFVYICSILGAVIVFLGAVLFAMIGRIDLSLKWSYVVASITYFMAFFLLQRVSAWHLGQQGYNVSKIWDTETRLTGLFGGALFWPLMALPRISHHAEH